MTPRRAGSTTGRPAAVASAAILALAACATDRAAVTDRAAASDRAVASDRAAPTDRAIGGDRQPARGRAIAVVSSGATARQHTRTGVPWLMDLPLVGGLFCRTTTSR